MYLDYYTLDYGIEALFTAVFISISLMLAVVLRRTQDPAAQKFFLYAWAARMTGSFAQVFITRNYYGLGDIMGYWAEGVVIAEELRADPISMFPRYVLAFLRADVALPFPVLGNGSTGSQAVFSSFILFFTGGSFYAASIVVSFLAMLGGLGVYHTLKEDLPRSCHGAIFVGCTMLPTAVYWCGSLSKEAVATAFLGFLTYSLNLVFVRRKLLLGTLVLLFSAVVIAMIKPYILVPFSLGTGAWLYIKRQNRARANVVARPVYIAAAAAIVLGTLAFTGWLSPEYSAENIEERTKRQQQLSAQSVGGSSLDAQEPSGERTPIQQLALAPFALATSLFRPFLFEANSVVLFVSSLETTLLLTLLVMGARKIGLRTLFSKTINTPALILCFVFVMAFGTAVGLVTSNLGTLSRYRIPMMPFFTAFIGYLWSAARPVAVVASLSTDSIADAGSATGERA